MPIFCYYSQYYKPDKCNTKPYSSTNIMFYCIDKNKWNTNSRVTRLIIHHHRSLKDKTKIKTQAKNLDNYNSF